MPIMPSISTVKCESNFDTYTFAKIISLTNLYLNVWTINVSLATLTATNMPILRLFLVAL